MGTHSGKRRWLGIWTHTGRHSDSPVLEPSSSDEYVARHADRVYTDPVTEISSEHRHRRSRLWGSGALAAAVASAFVAAGVLLSTDPGTPPDGGGSVAVAPHTEDPVDEPEPDTEPPSDVTPTRTPQRGKAPSTGAPSLVPSPAATATATATLSPTAPVVRPSGPMPTVTQTVTRPPDRERPEPGPTVTITKTVRATETRYLPLPRVTVTITVPVPAESP